MVEEARLCIPSKMQENHLEIWFCLPCGLSLFGVGEVGQVVTVRGSNLPQANHRVEAVHVPEAPCVDFYVLDDAVQALEDYVGAPMTEVGENVVPVTAWLSGQGLHGIQTGAHHPRAQCFGPRFGPDPVGAVGADVLQGSHIRQALAVLGRRLRRLRLISNWGSGGFVCCADTGISCCARPRPCDPCRRPRWRA